jgi:hypothetical protein
MTCTVVESVILPVSLLQVIVKTYSLMVVRPVIVWVPPVTDFAPDQLPLAVQLDGLFSVLQLSFTLVPGRIGSVRSLLMYTAGLFGGNGLTVSCALAV